MGACVQTVDTPSGAICGKPGRAHPPYSESDLCEEHFRAQEAFKVDYYRSFGLVYNQVTGKVVNPDGTPYDFGEDEGPAS